MTTEQIDVPLEPLQTNPGPLSDIEDGEIPNLENHSSPILNKKTKKKSKSKKHSTKRKELENIDFNSSASEQLDSADDSDDGWWSKKKRHLNETRYHEGAQEEEDDIIIEDISFQKRDSFSKDKPFRGKNNKFIDENNPSGSPGDSGEDNDKNSHLYPCKAYIAYGKCTDPGCRCVHSPLTRESEIKRFIDENEDYFHQAFKKFPGITLAPPLLKALTEKFGPPPSPPAVNPANNSSPQGHLARPMPPPKFFPPQNHFPVPLSPTPTPPVFGFPPQQGHPFPNMFPPAGMHHPPQGFPGQSMFPGQPMQQMQPMQSMFNGINGMPPMVSQMNHGFGMMNNMNNIMNNMSMSPVPGNLGFQQMPYGMYSGNMGVGFPGANMNMMNSNPENKQIDIKIKSPEKKSSPKTGHDEKDRKQKSPDGTSSSKSSPSSNTKEITEEISRLLKRKSTEKLGRNGSSEKNSSSVDIQSMETDSATPESKSKEEDQKKARNDSTAEKIARLVELFKAKKQKTAEEPQTNKELKEDTQPQQSSPNKKEIVTALVPVPVVENHIPKQESKVLDTKKEQEKENKVEDSNRMNKMVEEKPVVENVKEDVKKVEVENKAKEDNGKKSIFENGSTNEALLRQLKSALPADQVQSAGSIKDLVNLYLKLGKKPGF